MDIKHYMNVVGQAARKASRAIARADTRQKNHALHAMADAIERDLEKLIAANMVDLENARQNGLEEAMIDRLTLSEKTVTGMAEGLRQIAALPDPVGEMGEFSYRPSGIQLGKMRVPLAKSISVVTGTPSPRAPGRADTGTEYTRPFEPNTKS